MYAGVISSVEMLSRSFGCVGEPTGAAGSNGRSSPGELPAQERGVLGEQEDATVEADARREPCARAACEDSQSLSEDAGRGSA